MKNLILLSLFLTMSFCTVSKSNFVASNTSSEDQTSTINPEDFKTELLGLVNQLREKGCRCGRKRMRPVPPVSWNKKLEQAAQTHANDMAKNNFFEHQGSDKSSISDRITKAGYNWQAVSENIFWGEGATPKEVFQGWKDSPSHCKNMMDKSYDEMGIANAGYYWVQDFGKRFN